MRVALHARMTTLRIWKVTPVLLVAVLAVARASAQVPGATPLADETVVPWHEGATRSAAELAALAHESPVAQSTARTRTRWTASEGSATWSVVQWARADEQGTESGSNYQVRRFVVVRCTAAASCATAPLTEFQTFDDPNTLAIGHLFVPVRIEFIRFAHGVALRVRAQEFIQASGRFCEGPEPGDPSPWCDVPLWSGDSEAYFWLSTSAATLDGFRVLTRGEAIASTWTPLRRTPPTVKVRVALGEGRVRFHIFERDRAHRSSQIPLHAVPLERLERGLAWLGGVEPPMRRFIEAATR